jgi:hypothetical protein
MRGGGVEEWLAYLRLDIVLYVLFLPSLMDVGEEAAARRPQG